MSSRTVIPLGSGGAKPGKPECSNAVDSASAAGANVSSMVFSNAANHDLRGVFQTVEMKKLLEAVLSGLEKHDAVYLIAGKPGSGKSTFLRWMLQQIPADWEFCHITATKALGERHLLECLSRSLFQDLDLDIEALTIQIKQRIRGGAHIVVVVDDAERLSPFALKALFVIKAAVEKRGARLGLVLAADNAIQSTLAMPSLAALSQGRVRRLTLPPFTYQQTQDYIQHCLKVAGAGHEISFAPRQLRRIYSVSRGFPKDINIVMQGVLHGEEVVQSPVSQLGSHVSHYRVFILSVVAFGLIVGGGYGVYRSLLESAPPVPVTAAVPEAHLRELMLLPVPTQDVAAAPDREHEKAVKEDGDVSLSVTQTPAPKKAVEASTPKAAMPSVQQQVQVRKPQQPVQQSMAKTQLAQGIRGSAWVLAQNSAHFTVQLTSWEDEDRARKYIERNGLLNKAAYVHTRSKGKDWYLVIYNAYPTLKQARQAIRQLPPALRKYGPWVRNISSLQAEAVID